MKFSYSPQLNKYVVTELGRLIDSDDDAEELLLRHGFLCHEPDEATGMFGERSLSKPDDAIASDDDDDLALINDFLLFNDDHDTPTNYQSTGIGA